MKAIFYILLISSVLNSTAQNNSTKKNKMMTNLETATFGNGCYWCTEAIFQRLNGVESVASGFSGGFIKNPAYREVVTGRTGHAEVIQIKYNPSVISFQELLEVFFSTHDPTTLNQQGYDIGTQYRSAIFYHSENQKTESEVFIKQLDEATVFDSKIVTEVTKFEAFYKAEDYHQNYYNNNKTQGYCTAVINPKLDKFMKNFKSKLKK